MNGNVNITHENILHSIRKSAVSYYIVLQTSIVDSLQIELEGRRTFIFVHISAETGTGRGLKSVIRDQKSRTTHCRPKLELDVYFSIAVKRWEPHYGEKKAECRIVFTTVSSPGEVIYVRSES